MRLVVEAVVHTWLKLLVLLLFADVSFFKVTTAAFWSTTSSSTCSISRRRRRMTTLHRDDYRVTTSTRAVITAPFGWLQDYFEPPKKKESSQSSTSTCSRQVQYPEQYPATYEMNTDMVQEDYDNDIKLLVRPLLKNTQLQTRPLQLVYDSEQHGWNAAAFHQCVDGKGAAIVLAKTVNGKYVGGYNAKGWASLGGARPSVAAFLFYEKDTGSSSSPRLFQKLRKVGGGGLACARDDYNFGISFGPDALVIGLQQQQQQSGSGGREKLAQSKLGPYYERGPDNLSSLFDPYGSTELVDLKVLVGCYENDEDIPYSGGVLDMTSG